MFFKAESITKSYSGKPVLSNVSFCVDTEDIVSFIGPSGVGKTTLLRIIAGLDKADSGDLIFQTPPNKENPVILVFQDYLLFPNLTIFENTAFGLRARNAPNAEITKRVMTLLDYFCLANKHDHYPATLSSGQRQRVALARAIVVNPALLLLDEPFANLDRDLKLRTAEFIRDTQKEFGVTTIAVTHDQEEAFVMSDAVGVMLDGALAQFAPAREIYDNPVNLDVARFIGPMNELSPELAAQLNVLPTKDGYYVRPEQLHIMQDPNGHGIIENVTFAGHYLKFSVNMGQQTVIVFSTDNSINPADRVTLSLKKG